MSVKDDRKRLLDHTFERGDSGIALDRAALYFQVVKALVPSHGIRDNDPERAVAEALGIIDGMARHAQEGASHDGAKKAQAIGERARDLTRDVGESGL